MSRRTELVQIRLTEAEKAALQSEAGALSLSEFIRRKLGLPETSRRPPRKSKRGEIIPEMVRGPVDPVPTPPARPKPPPDLPVNFDALVRKLVAQGRTTPSARREAARQLKDQT